ncbi:MAG: NAD(P)-dependent glycerol-3-phosphate dehydrogenase [Deltaproteobacteria bacterium]|nr:NAD(P)-dependent glycerol-3-phosphate dehydrogenase [Deltaproteobacteria bacterium]
MASITVIGGGAWGTALANLLAEKGEEVCLWIYEKELLPILEKERENKWYLPGIRLHQNLRFTNDLSKAIQKQEIILWATPSQHARSLMEKAAHSLQPGATVIVATKGIDGSSLKTVGLAIEEIVPKDKKAIFASLSGPTFAKDVAQKKPTGLALAMSDISMAQRLQKLLSAHYFKVYINQDRIGTELGGALKNVIAIGAGVCDGFGFGYSARAALITRGLAEISRLGLRMGADPRTFTGLAGLGDLVLTATGDLSRNRRLGIALAQGKRLEEVTQETKEVIEGVEAARHGYLLSQKYRVDMPNTTATYQVLYEGKSPRDAVQELLSRPPKEEWL